ncbi:MAG: MBL fold metallo-hydrolase [Gammaproteobacteria bacterium]
MKKTTRPSISRKRATAIVLVAQVFGFCALRAQGVDFAAAEINVLHVQGNVYMLAGPVGNTTVQIGEQGVVVVDTQFAELSDKILDAIASLTDKPIRYVINTHAHGDHIGGNEAIAQAGITITAGNVAGAISDADVGAAILAHENAYITITQADPPIPFDGWPTETFFVPQRDLYFNGEAIQLLHQPSAHTNGDIIVYFRKSDVISAGDVFVTTTYPLIDQANGGHINGIIDALNTIIRITVPADKQEGGTYVIPGHGRLADEADVVEYRDMLTIIRDRVQAMVDDGMNLRRVLAAEPTRDYDGRFGADSGFWTTRQFIEAVYENLSEQ